MRMRWPFRRGKKGREYRRRSVKVRQAEFDLGEARRKAKLREEWLKELKESDPQLYNRIMAKEFEMTGLFQELEEVEGEPGGEGFFQLQDSMQGLFVEFLKRKLSEDEGDALATVMQQIQTIEEVKGMVSAQSGEGLGGIALALANILNGPIGTALAQAMFAAKVPGGMAGAPGAQPMAIGPPQQAMPLAQEPQEEEMPTLPDWIPLESVMGLLDETPEDAALELLAFAARQYNEGQGRPLEGLNTLIQIPIPMVRATLVAYRGHAQYGPYVERILAKGAWLEEFLAILKDNFERLQNEENIWETTSVPTETESEPTEAPAP